MRDTTDGTFYPTVNGVRNKMRTTASGFERRNKSARKRGQRIVVRGRRVPKWYIALDRVCKSRKRSFMFNIAETS